jgi:hypothetical protein
MDWIVTMDWNKLATNSLAILGALQIILGALIGIFMLIPGAEPERTLQKILDFISRFSRKGPQAQIMSTEQTPPPQPQLATPSTFDVAKMVIALVYKLTQVFSDMAKDQNFTDFLNDLDQTIKDVKNAKTQAERIDAAVKLSRIARRL